MSKHIKEYSSSIPRNEIVFCQCGCGSTILKYDKRGRTRNFLPSHWSKTQPKNRIIVYCTNCSKPIEKTPSKIKKVKLHFCCQKCEGEHSTKTGRRHGANNGHYNTITVACSGCGSPVSKAKSLIKRRNERVYCSDCIPLTKQGQKGFYIGYPKEFSPNLRHRIRKRDNFTCQVCFRHQDIVGTLHVHHIDYDKYNNNSINLIALCRNCHGRTNWATDTWKEKFTDIMKIRFPDSHQVEVQ